MSKILVTGSASGLGREISRALIRAKHDVVLFDIETGDDVRQPAGEPPEGLDILVNCAGVNRSGWLDEFPESQWDAVMDTNAKGIFMMAKWAYSELRKTRGTILNIVSNASHVPMTASAAYNASKGAAHILTLQLARELMPKNGITVFGVAPNKLAGTFMSRAIEAAVIKTRGWTAEFAAEYQRNALPAGEETDPVQLADFIAYLLQTKAHHKYLCGCVLPYGA